MSQSGCINSPRNNVLYATEAMWMVCEAGSLGQKSSDALITAVFFALNIIIYKNEITLIEIIRIGS